MAALSEDALKAQITTLLQTYTSAAKDAGIETPIAVSNTGVVGVAMSGNGDIINSLNTLNNLGNLNTMTQIPTTWSGVVNMLPSTGMFSMESMIWSTVSSFVFLWLLWYSKERAKARIWARAFHKQAKKFMKEYREEEKEYEKEKRKQAATEASNRDLPTALQTPQVSARPDMTSVLGPSTPSVSTTPTTTTPPPSSNQPTLNMPFHL